MSSEPERPLAVRDEDRPRLEIADSFERATSREAVYVDNAGQVRSATRYRRLQALET